LHLADPFLGVLLLGNWALTSPILFVCAHDPWQCFRLQHPDNMCLWEAFWLPDAPCLLGFYTLEANFPFFVDGTISCIASIPPSSSSSSSSCSIHSLHSSLLALARLGRCSQFHVWHWPPAPTSTLLLIPSTGGFHLSDTEALDRLPNPSFWVARAFSKELRAKALAFTQVARLWQGWQYLPFPCFPSSVCSHDDVQNPTKVGTRATGGSRSWRRV